MSEKTQPTNEPEVKEVQPEQKTDEKQSEKTDAKTQDKEEVSLGDVLQTTPKADNSKPDSVPFEVFEMSKKEVKDLKQQLKDLQSKVEEGKASAEDIQSDLDSIGEEYNVDKNFLKKVEKSLVAQVEKRVEQRLKETLRPLEEANTKKEKVAVLNQHIDQILENKPDLKGVVNKNVITELAFLPSNSNKTLSQLIEQVYGNAVAGKATVETTTPAGGKEPKGVDFDKAKRDPAYFKEVMSDPELKKQYNADLAKRVVL